VIAILGVALCCQSHIPSRLLYANQLAQQLQLPLLQQSSTSLLPSGEGTRKADEGVDEGAIFPYWLVVTDHRLELHQSGTPEKPVYVDFLGADAQYRCLKSNRKNELIAKAVGLKNNSTLSIIDATAGLGRDGFILSTLGCIVRCLERSPIIAALLQDGIDRLQNTSAPNVSLSLTATDALTYLEQLDYAEFPDVIYLDPMFPTRQKSALVKKEMRMLRDLVGDDLDTAALLDLALRRAKKRVVVKQPRLAPQHIGKTPSIVFSGQSCRFDVYLTKK